MTSPDHNDQLGQGRTCVHCGETTIPSKQNPGWTPAPELGGWICPDCTRKAGNANGP